MTDVPGSRFDYFIHGLQVSSNIALEEDPGRGDGAVFSVDHLGTAEIPQVPADGRLMTDPRALTANKPMSLTQTDTGYNFRLHNAMDADIDTGLGRAVLRTAPGFSVGQAGLLIAGNLVNVVLVLRRSLVLHASAVTIDGSVVGFMGDAGMGKSTIAALASIGGAEFFSDDLLRLDRDGSGWKAWRGSGAARLRRGSWAIAAHSNASDPTSDGRLRAGFHAHHDESAPLAAVLIPLIRRDASDVHIDVLKPADAVVALHRYPRLGWVNDRDLLEWTFDANASLASTVPIATITVPWADGPDERLGHLIRAEVESFLALR